MKIGIITFHRAHNYGAVLQCYALSTRIKSMGHNVEVIDYCPTYFKKQYSFFPKEKFAKSSWKGKIYMIIIYLITFLTRLYRFNHFNAFIRTLPLSKQIQEDDVDNLSKGYDIIIWGSDQVWNPRLTDKIDSVYTGKIKKGNAIFASYAASTTIYKNDEYMAVYESILQTYDYISVREKSLETFFRQLTDKDLTTVVDPVLLLSREEWHRIAIAPKEENYLLVYTVPQHPNIIKIAKRIAKEMHLKLIELVPREKINFHSYSHQKVSPEEFVGYFEAASFVISTSFHGTAFAIKMQKPFYTLLMGNEVDNRSLNLLKSLGIEQRGISVDCNSYIEKEPVDYEKVDILLSQIVSESEIFLSKVAHNSVC